MFKQLVRLNLQAMIQRGLARTRGANQQGFLILVGFVAFILILFFGILFYSFFDLLRISLTMVGMNWLFFGIYGVVSVGICLFITLFITIGMFTHAQDTKLLTVLPIHPRDIILSRTVVPLLLNMLVAYVLGIPVWLAWRNGGNASFGGTIAFWIGTLLLPLIPTALSLLVTLLVQRIRPIISSKLLPNVILIIGIRFILTTFAGSNRSEVTEGIAQWDESSVFYRFFLLPFQPFAISVMEPSFVYSLVFIGSVLLMAIASLLIVFYFRKWMVAEFVRRSAAKKRRAVRKRLSILSTLVQKELRMIKSKPLLLLNSSVGSLFLLYIAFQNLFREVSIFSFLSESSFFTSSSTYLIIGFLSMLAASNQLSASMISWEGPQFQLLQSLPLSCTLIFFAKIIAQNVFTLFPIILASFSFLAVKQFSVLELFLLFILPVVSSVTVSFLGLCVNLCYPNFSWTNEMQMVKRSASVTITSIITFAIIGVIILAWMNVGKHLDMLLWILFVLFLGSCYGMYRWLLTVGQTKWERLAGLER